MRIEPYKPEHFMKIRLQESQKFFAGFQTEDEAENISQAEIAMSGIADNGDILVIAGLFQVWPGRKIAWAFISGGCQHELVSVFRAIERFLKITEKGVRIETHVKTDFPQGHRFAKLLGFRNEGTMAKFGIDGLDYDLYAKVT